MSTQIDNAAAAGFTAAIDLDKVSPDAVFKATWSFTNSGTTTWDGRYQFVYTIAPHPETAAFPRVPLAAKSAYAITELGAPPAVPPGETVQLTLTFTAPNVVATHATNWQLQAPDGRRFGPVRWLRAVVKAVAGQPAVARQPAASGQPATDKRPTPTPTPASFSPEEWRSAIWDITSVFESGRPGGRADAYQNSDSGIVSYGKHQATLQSGNLERVLTAYFQRSSSPACHSLQQEYAARVKNKEESLRHDARFKELLLAAAGEEAMRQAQDAHFEQNFYQPTTTRARELGVKTPLGLACLYDARVQGGQGGLNRILELVAQKLGSPGPSDSVDEPTWIRAFLDEREAWLGRVADNKEQEGKLQDAGFLRTSTFRVAELRKLLHSGNLNLAGEFTVRDQRIRGLREEMLAKLADKIADKPTDEPAGEPVEKIDLLAYIKGDGRQYEIKNAWGSQERVQTQEDAGNFYHVKNAQWEQFFHDNDFIYRDVDTSPGAGRFYRQKDADLPRGSRWLCRYMAVGQTHTQARQVQFYNKADGSTSAQNSGNVTDTIKLIARHPQYRFPTGIELNDVVELEWVNGRERYFYAKNYGLVGWERKHDDPHTPPWSAISEIHQPGTRDPFDRERVPLP
jgi:hypothetical protein